MATMMFAAGKANALDVAVMDYNGEEAIFISGDFLAYDQDVFTSIAKANPDITTVIIGDSEGGLTSASYPIAYYIRDNNMNTVILKDAVAVSSMAIVWSAGIKRTIETGGTAKLHLPYVPAQKAIDYIESDEYCDDEDVCRPWTKAEGYEIYNIWNLAAVGTYYDFMILMDYPPEWISGIMKTNINDFLQLTGE